MADRKKQPKRGARKGNPSEPNKAADAISVEALELHFELIGIQRKNGEIVGKEVMAHGAVVPSEFAALPVLLADAQTQHREAVEAAQASDG